jgi:hypothetical protein
VKPALIAIIAVPVVAAVSAAAWFALRPAPEATDLRVAGVQEAVRARLVDPASATFGAIDFAAQGGGMVACGTVNAKNQLGGYTGAQPFKARHSSGQTFDVLLLAQSDAEASAIRQMCADDGMAVGP